MSDASLRWQKENMAKAQALIEEFDLGAAAREASAKGRALTAQELEGFRHDTRTALLPHKILVFDGVHYSYA